MRRFLMHSVACGRDLDHIARFGSARMRCPDFMLCAIAIPILARLGLWVIGIFQCMIAIRNAYVINIGSELLAFPEMQNTFMRPSPVITKIRFVFVMPD